ncbi:MAG: DUF4249 domain-containing protein [Prolixibacteraceae bacterium]|nr:DUF4249 domain-containing protein [Prolixibacteraceae bacterium]
MSVRNVFTKLILLLPVFFAACEKTIEFTDEEVATLLVVNCKLIPGENIEVDLTHTIHALDESEYFEPVKDATITISDGTAESSEFSYVPKYDSIMRWDNSRQVDYYDVIEKGTHINKVYEIKEGHTYTLEIDAAGYEKVFAEASIPDKPVILSTDTTSEIESNEYSKLINRIVKLKFSDTPSKKNFYEIKAQKAELMVYFDPYTGETNISPSVYNQFLDIQDPIFEPDESDIIDDLISSYTGTYLFDDALIDGKTYTMTFQYDYQYLSQYEVEDPYATSSYNFSINKIMLISMDETMYKYMQTSSAQGYTNFFSEPVLVYTNILNGAGVFGGYNENAVYIVTHNFSEEMLDLLPEGDAEDLFNYIVDLTSEYSYYYY